MHTRLACLLILVTAMLTPHAQAQTSDAPYIYYFSNQLNAFVIERADGSDPHLLGDGLMTFTAEPRDIFSGIYVDGPGWSPSGQWFAWTAEQVSVAPGYSGARPYVLSADGARRLTLLDHLQDAQLMWAADADVLFVASHQTERLNPDDLEDTHTTIDTYFAVVDVAQEQVIASTEEHTLSDYYLYDLSLQYPVDMVRTNDGEHIIVRYTDFEGGDSYYGTLVLVVLDTVGTLSEMRRDAFGPVSMDDNSPAFPSISPAGWVAYPTAEDFRIDNVLTSESHQFAPLDNPNQIAWDASGQYALLSDGRLWLLDCAAGSISLLREAWAFADHYSAIDPRPIWSPESNHAFLFGVDGTLYTFSREDGTLEALPLDTFPDFTNVGWSWLDDHRVFFFHDGTPDYVQNGIPSLAAIYDFEIATVQYLDIDFPTWSTLSPRFSPDEQTVAFVRDGPILWDRATGTEQETRPAYDSLQSEPGGEVAWAEDGEWLLVFEDALVAGGATVRSLGVMRTDGTLRRDLVGRGWRPNPIGLNWLPPQVDPTRLPPAPQTPLFPQPALTLHGSQWSRYVEWSPDGRWIAAGSAVFERDDDDITVWNVNTGKVVHVFKLAGEDEWVSWPRGDTFIPDLVTTNARNENILAQSPDGRQQVQIINRTIWVIDPRTGDRLVELPKGWDVWDPSASYSPDGRLLATIDGFTPLRLWDTNTWELLASLPVHGYALAFSPDSSRLALTASWDVQVWDVAHLLELGVQD